MLLLPCRHSLISNNHTRRPGLQLRLGHLNYKKKKKGGASPYSAFMKILLSFSVTSKASIMAEGKTSEGRCTPHFSTDQGQHRQPTYQVIEIVCTTQVFEAVQQFCPFTVLTDVLHMPFASLLTRHKSSSSPQKSKYNFCILFYLVHVISLQH